MFSFATQFHTELILDRTHEQDALNYVYEPWHFNKACRNDYQYIHICYQDLLHAKQHNKIMSIYWHDLCQNIQQRETEENNILFGFNS